MVNTFFGGSVTCAGLLTGADIRAALEREGERLGETILIPSISLKDDEDIFLDDLLLHDLETQIGRPTVRAESTARGLVDAVLGHDLSRQLRQVRPLFEECVPGVPRPQSVLRHDWPANARCI